MEPMTLITLFAVAYFALYIFTVWFLCYKFPVRNRIEYNDISDEEVESCDWDECDCDCDCEEEEERKSVPEWLSYSAENNPRIKEEVESRYNLFHNTITTPGMMGTLHSICFGDSSILKIVPNFYLEKLLKGRNVNIRLDIHFTSGKVEEIFLESDGNTFTEAAREILSSLVYEFGYDNSSDLNMAACYTVFPLPTTNPSERIYLPELLFAYTKAFDHGLEDPVEDFYERVALILLEAREEAEAEREREVSEN